MPRRGGCNLEGTPLIENLKKNLFSSFHVVPPIFFNPLAFASKRVRSPDGDRSSKADASGPVTGHLPRPISRFACFSGARAARDSRSLSVPVLLRVIRRRRPFRFFPLDSPRGADPNFEFRRNGWRPPTSRRRRVRFVPPEPRGGRHPLVLTCRPSPFLAAPLFRSGAFLLSKEGAARMMPAIVESKRSPAAPSSGAKRESETKRKHGEEWRRSEQARHSAINHRPGRARSEAPPPRPRSDRDSTQIAEPLTVRFFEIRGNGMGH